MYFKAILMLFYLIPMVQWTNASDSDWSLHVISEPVELNVNLKWLLTLEPGPLLAGSVQNHQTGVLPNADE